MEAKPCWVGVEQLFNTGPVWLFWTLQRSTSTSSHASLYFSGISSPAARPNNCLNPSHSSLRFPHREVSKPIKATLKVVFLLVVNVDDDRIESRRSAG
jgi:hypothetical protein